MDVSTGPSRFAGTGALVDGRYRLGELLGEGGMARVYEALDVSTGEPRALKRLTPASSVSRQRHHAELFEREFHTLAQLAHPRIVAVRDYGLDGDVPYYTMELLSGGDLASLVPLDWRQACAIARDVCSALSLVHSRRMVHRDASPRNIRITADGSAKLIDFGAMVPMGPAKHTVGTPPLCPPEAVEGGCLDARTDLFTLGATLYFVLTGRHAYPAQNFRQLRSQWASRPRVPSRLSRDIPRALDELVMSAIQLDPQMRPSSAAELMERLGAIADLPADEQLPVAEAYLSMPTLVGRDRALASIRKKVARTIKTRGQSVLVVGEPGTGKSRFLDACALEAKLLGAAVLRANAASAGGEDYAVARALARQLMEALPALAQRAAGEHAALLAPLVPQLLSAAPRPGGAEDDPELLRPRLQAALRDWLGAVADRHPLVITVDDVDAIDEPSAALLALLAHAARRSRLLLLATVDPAFSHRSFGRSPLLFEHSGRVELGNLTASETARLLRSVFGEVPNLQRTARHMHEVAQGNPRDIMQLAQHLVDSGFARYGAGSWELPAEVDLRRLPSSFEQTLRLQIDGLDAETRELAQAMGLSPGTSFHFAQCQLLAGHDSAGQLVQSLDRLVAAGVVQLAGERYVLRHQGFVGVLQDSLRAAGPDRALELHGRLAAMHRAAGDDLRAARHLWHAGRQDEAIDLLVAHAQASERATDESFELYLRVLRTLPADWAEIYQAAMRACVERGRPQRDLFALRSRYCGFTSPNGVSAGEAMSGLLRQLAHACGLDLYHSVDASLPAAERTALTLELARARFEQSDPAQRVLPPVEATDALSRAVMSALGPISMGLDHEACIALPSLEPLEPLSPTLALVRRLAQGVRERLAGRVERAREIYSSVLQRLSCPDGAGLDPTYHQQVTHAVSATLARIEAPLGLPTALSRASLLEDSSNFIQPALMVRAIHHLWQGDAARAEACKEEAELLSLQHRPPQFAESSHLPAEITAHAAADDLTRVKQTIAAIEPMARMFVGWLPILAYARGEYHRIRGDLPRALEWHERALSRAAPGRHSLWGEIAAAHVGALCALGQVNQAVAAGLSHLRAAEHHQLAHAARLVELPLSLAHARRGDRDESVAMCDRVIAYLEDLGASGLIVGLAHETRARIGLELGDAAAFERHADACAAHYEKGGNPALSKKLERLRQDARRESVRAPRAGDDAALASAPDVSHVVSVLEECPGPSARAERILHLLIEHSGAAGGFLYGLGEDGPVQLSRQGVVDTPEVLTTLVSGCLTPEPDDTTATDFASEIATQSALHEVAVLGEHGEHYRPVLLAHPAEEGFIATGVVILVLEPGAEFVYPGPLAIELSRAALQYGDTIPVHLR